MWRDQPRDARPAPPPPQAPRPRIVQHAHRRYSIRLEPVFWKFLEFLAQRQGIRLGRYIASLATAYSGNNLSSHLRVVCMLEAERAAAQARLVPTRDSLLELVRASPSPGLVVARSRTILAANAPFAAWLGPDGPDPAGRELGDIVQVRTTRSFTALWADMVAGRQKTFKAHVLHVRPGRVAAAQASLVPLRARAGDAFHVVIWLEARPPRAGAAPRTTPPAPPA